MKPIIKHKIVKINKNTILYRVRNKSNNTVKLNTTNLFFITNDNKYCNFTLLQNIFTLYQFRKYENNNNDVNKLDIDVYKITEPLYLYYLNNNVNKYNFLTFEKKIHNIDDNYSPNFYMDKKKNMLSGDNFKTATWINKNDNIDGWFCSDYMIDEIMIAKHSQNKIINTGVINIHDFIPILFNMYDKMK